MQNENCHWPRTAPIGILPYMEQTAFVAIVMLAFALIPIALIVFVIGATRHSESVARGARQSPLLVWLSSLVLLPLAAIALITGHGLLTLNLAVLNGLFIALLMRQAYLSGSSSRHLVFWERTTVVMLIVVLLGGVWTAVQSALAGESLFSQTSFKTLALIGVIWMYRRGRDAITNDARQSSSAQ